MPMLGRDFAPGVVYTEDGLRWLKVRTRGPLITRGVAEPIVRLTVEGEDGAVFRCRVQAWADYPTAAAPAPRSGAELAGDVAELARTPFRLVR
ncbi:hypothetical protein [Prauserella flavalba]|uniref:Uncharacterized protein n=1 Tax=Prauserella flavalba TaxID=1477506 RepID=A0A318LH93_9PSEU|nr:hypothetical protein [Prauserella flavalba]PXY28661.1 hypothetical protein BA062_22675 [Prauserella flavalba]